MASSTREDLAPSRPDTSAILIEPFAGGGTVSLTAVMEGLADRALMVEIDRDVSAFWRAALEHGDQLVERVLSFNPDRASVERLAAGEIADVLDHGFRTLVMIGPVEVESLHPERH